MTALEQLVAEIQRVTNIETLANRSNYDARRYRIEYGIAAEAAFNFIRDHADALQAAIASEPPAQAADRLSAGEREALERIERLGSVPGYPLGIICAALRRLAAPVADGFVLVPREPTEAMLAAAPERKNFCCPDSWEVWASMLAATPPAGDAARGDG